MEPQRHTALMASQPYILYSIPEMNVRYLVAEPGGDTFMFVPPAFISTGSNVFHFPGEVSEGCGSTDERAPSRNRTTWRKDQFQHQFCQGRTNYSPVSPPDSPDLETYLQYINQEHRESNCVGGGDFNHS